MGKQRLVRGVHGIGRTPHRLLAVLSVSLFAYSRQTVSAFLLPAVSSHSSATKLSAVSNRYDDCVSRAISIQVASVAILAFVASPSIAAVPTLQEYYGEEGAQPKTNNFILNSKRQRQQGEKSANNAASSVAETASPSDPEELIESMTDTLYALSPLIKKEGWDDVLAAVKRKPLCLLLTPFLGYGNAAELAKALGGDLKKSRALEERRQEASVALQQLVDYAFSNRVIFFNSLDKQQVTALASGRAPPDLSEPLGLLEDTVGLVKALQETL